MENSIKQIDNFYTIKVWLACIFLAPLLFVVWALIIGENTLGKSPVAYGFLLCFGLLLSLPSLLINYLIFRLLTRTRVNVILVKTILFVVGMIIFEATFWILGTSVTAWARDKWFSPFAYIILFLIATFYFSIFKKQVVTNTL
ncbi:MAG: hypothetical protein M3R25_00290 [Bacteroidota bacterium]|nr:hypothetical protein [Bacteroidota bacterium]